MRYQTALRSVALHSTGRPAPAARFDSCGFPDGTPARVAIGLRLYFPTQVFTFCGVQTSSPV